MELYRLTGSFGCLSMVGAFLILFTYFFVKSIRKHPTTLILYMAICDFFFGFKFLITSIIPNSSDLQQKDHLFCVFQATFAQFWGLGTIGWIGMISVNMIINMRNPFANTAPYAKFYHAWVWGYAAITTTLLVVLNEYGPSGDGTCWIAIDDNDDSINFFQLTFFVPLLFYFLIAILALLYTTARTKQVFEGQPKSARQLMFRMRMFVVLFIMFWTGPIVHRVCQYFNYETYSVVLIYWDAISVSAQGMGNAFVWLSHPLVFKGLRKSPVFGRLWSRTAEHVPLLERLGEELEDQEDIQKLDVLLRKNIITSILLGIKLSTNEVDDKEAMSENLEAANVKTEYVDVFNKKEHENKGRPPIFGGISTDFSKNILDDLRRITLRYFFRDYSPLIFHRLRMLMKISTEQYLASLDPESFLGNLKNQKFSEGRSGSFFCFSPDKNFIMKTIEASEVKILMKILPRYCQHLERQPNSMLCRIYGLHSVRIQNDVEIFVIIMQNLFNTTRNIHEKYDLKGSWVARSVKEHAEDSSALGKDMDLKRKIKVGQQKKEELMKQLAIDTRFLRIEGIMDYSLLVGFHFLDKENEIYEEIAIDTDLKQEPSHENSLNLTNEGILSSDGKEIYYMGLIDILQLYNFQKKMERCFKIYCLRNNRRGLSVQPVRPYNTRFLTKIDEHFE